MTNSVPALLGVLLLVALSMPAMAITAAGPTPAADEPSEATNAAVESSATNDHLEIDETVNRLSVGENGTTSITTPSADLGTYFATEDEAIDYEFYWHSVEANLTELREEIEPLEANVTSLEDEADAIEAEVVELEAELNETDDEDEAEEIEAEIAELESQLEAVEADVEANRATIDALETAQTERVAETLAWLEDRMQALGDREQAVAQRHADGEAIDDEVLRTITKHHQEALVIEALVERLFELDQDLLSSITGDASDYNAKLEVYTSPVRDHITEKVVGPNAHAADTAVTLETSQTGLALATIQDGEYLRETIRYDNRDWKAPADEEFDWNDLFDMIKELYPDASVDGVSNDRVGGFYEVDLAHEHGALTLHFDRTTSAFYSERQQLDLDALPSTDETSWSDGSLDVTFEQTPVGPAQLTTIDDGEPVDATVSVDGVVLGETGADGTLWLTLPVVDGGNEFELRVESQAETVTETVEA